MSTVMCYSAVRFKFSKKFGSVNEMYLFIKELLGEPDNKEFKCNWDEVSKGFKYTSDVEHFRYEEIEGKYVVLQSYQTGEWYLDYLLETPAESCDDINVSVSLDRLMEIKEKTFSKFIDCLEEDCKLKVYEWYTGCDMPVDF